MIMTVVVMMRASRHSKTLAAIIKRLPVGKQLKVSRVTTSTIYRARRRHVRPMTRSRSLTPVVPRRSTLPRQVDERAASTAAYVSISPSAPTDIVSQNNFLRVHFSVEKSSHRTWSMHFVQLAFCMLWVSWPYKLYESRTGSSLIYASNVIYIG